MDTSRIIKDHAVKLPTGDYIIDAETRAPRLFTEVEAKLFVEGKPWLTVIKLD